MWKRRASGVLRAFAILALLPMAFVGSQEPAAALAGVASVSTGVAHSCLLDTDGKAFCWGFNDKGQLGDGTTITRLGPTAVDTALRFTSIGVGNAYTCGLAIDGSAYCWGINAGAQLGLPMGAARYTPSSPVSGGHTFSQISVGFGSACGLESDGEAWCWGYGGKGQLGDGNAAASSNTPVLVAGVSNFRALSGGRQHFCGVTIGNVGYCWGYNASGELGTGDNTDSLVPVIAGSGIAFESISTGYGSSDGAVHTCGIAIGGSAYCWGIGSQGRLGRGTFASSNTAVPVNGTNKYSSISIGGYQTCAVDLSGDAYCWGGGPLGDGVNAQSNIPSLVLGGHKYRTVHAGRTFACGTTAAGAMCWGTNGSGELGDNTTTLRLTPVPVWLHVVTANTSVALAVDSTFTFTVAGRSSACNGLAPTTTASASSVALEHVTTAAAASGAQDLTVSSNASAGFVVYQRANAPNGPRALASVSGTNASPSTFGTGERFGYTVDDADLPGFAGPLWAAVSPSGASVMQSASATAGETNCVLYQVAIDSATPAGTYATTVSYTAVPTF